MVSVHIRKQGGAAVITIPSVILKTLDLKVGSALELETKGDCLLAHPVSKKKHKRYSLKELLKGATPENITALNTETSWALEGNPVGKELA